MLSDFGFKRCAAEMCVYILVRAGSILIIAIYVDDSFVSRNDKQLFDEFLTSR